MRRGDQGFYGRCGGIDDAQFRRITLFMGRRFNWSPHDCAEMAIEDLLAYFQDAQDFLIAEREAMQ